MSFRDLFVSKNETHSRRHRRAKQAELISAHVERLEVRSLLSAIIPGLSQHGLVFSNADVGGRQNVVLDQSINGQLSNNTQGAGLWVTLNGQTQLRNLSLANLRAFDNGSAGIVVDLTNLQLDTLTIDATAVARNGGAGLVLRLNNAQVGRILIQNNGAGANANAGIHVESVNSRVNLVQILGTNMQANQRAGLFVHLDNTPVGGFALVNSRVIGNGAHGARFDFDDSSTPSLALADNLFEGTTLGHGLAIDFEGSSTTVKLARNIFRGQVNGDGMRLRLQTSPGGFRSIGLETFQNNTFEGNAGSGFFAEMERDTVLRGLVTRNVFRNNGGFGFFAQAADTENALDLTIGGLTRNPQGQLIDANTFDANTGAAIALSLTDPSGLTGDTTGRVRIWGNTIVNTAANGLPGYTGEGIHLSATGSDVLANGAARWSQVRIDMNTIRGNAGHGAKFDISEDSQLVDLLIGNASGTNLRFDVDGNFEAPGTIEVLEQNDGNLIESNGLDGLHFLRRDTAFVRDVKVLDNMIRQNRDGIAFVARNTYTAVPTAAIRGNLVSEVRIDRNQIRNNRANGIHVRTEADAVLLANIKYNFIDGNAGNGIRASGLENNDTDFENIGGTWVKNRISKNGQNGIAIHTVTGRVNPLIIGQDGTDTEFEPLPLGRQSLGNYIFRNGEDGIDIASQIGLAGTVLPQDSFQNAMSIINNTILENGRNTIANGATPDPYNAGRGVDVEIFWGRSGGTGDLREIHLHRNRIQGNFGDGVELRNRGGTLRLFALGNTIDLNGGRGVDVLNQTGGINFSPEGHIVFGDAGTTTNAAGTFNNRNIVRSNGLEGFYVVNTASVNQDQNVDSRTDLLADADAQNLRLDIFANLMIDMENNEIRDNGRGITATGSPASTLSGAGLVVRVGTTNAADFFGTVADISGTIHPFTDSAAAGVGTNTSEFGNGRVNMRVVGNDFSGNAGDDVFMESFTSTEDPASTPGTWSEKEFKGVEPGYKRDPLARLNLVFTNNTGDSLDVVRGWFDAHGENAGAYYNNPEGDFKSRTVKDGANPDGPFGSGDADRARNAQRVADRPTSLGGLAEAWPGFTGDFSGASSFYGWPFTGPNQPETGFGSLSSIDASDPNGPIRITAGSRGGDIFDATNANPTVITSFSHGLLSGDHVSITGAQGNTAINNGGTNPEFWIVDQATFSTFRLINPLTGALVAGNGAYTGGGTWTQVQGDVSTGTASPLLGVHNLSTGDLITISDNDSFTSHRWEGTHAVSVIDSSTFALFVPVVGFSSSGTPVPGDGTSPAAAPASARYVIHNPNSFKYDGIGPSTFRIESNWDASGFTSNEFGDTFNDFATFEPGIYAGFPMQWDEVDPGTFSYVTAWVEDVVVNEISGTATFTVRLSEAAENNVTITYSTADGSAISGVVNQQTGQKQFSNRASDFIEQTGSITFTPGQTTRQIVVDLNNSDSSFDREERFYLDLLGITGGSLLDSRAVATIQPDTDAQPTVSVEDVTHFPERGEAVFTLRLSNPSSETIFVDFATQDGTATGDVDFERKSGTAMFDPNTQTTTVRVGIKPDTIVEGAETFLLNLSNARVVTPIGDAALTISDNQAVATILDTVFVSINDVVVSGFGTGTSTANVTVSLSKAVPAGQTVVVNYATGGGSATAGSDYTAVNGTLTFTSGGPLTQTVSITVNRDMVVEGDEFFFVNLTDGGNAVFANGDTQGRVTIREPGEVFAPGPGGGPMVRVMDAVTGEEKFRFIAYSGGFLGGVTVAQGDVNGDGFPDIITGTGEGGGPLVRVFDGINGSHLRDIFAYDRAYAGGVFVAAADLDGDNRAEIITGAGAGGPPLVQIFSGVDGSELNRFMAYNPAFTGGVHVAVADVFNTGTPQIITGTGFGGGPLVRIFDWTSDGSADRAQLTAYGPIASGVWVTAGDVNNDGHADVITGTGPGVGPLVRIFSGSDIANGTLTDDMGRFFAYARSYTGGVKVATGDVNGDGLLDIVTGTGPGGGPLVRAFTSAGTEINSFFAYNRSLTGGVFVSGRALGLPGEGSPLTADTSVTPIAGTGDSVGQDELQAIVSAAVTRFEAAGFDVAGLASTRFTITDLGGSLLGLARPGVVLIDDDAAGYGWFVDYSPLVDEEFAADESGRLIAADARAGGRMDLLSTVMHELGHQLGWTDLDAETHADDLMASHLQAGVRRELDSVFASDDLFDALLTA